MCGKIDEVKGKVVRKIWGHEGTSLSILNAGLDGGEWSSSRLRSFGKISYIYICVCVCVYKDRGKLVNKPKLKNVNRQFD
jgi:hypothetical protein